MRLWDKVERFAMRTRYSDSEESRTYNICDLKMCISSKRSPERGQGQTELHNGPRCTFHSALGSVQSYTAVIFYLFILCFINNVGCTPASYSSSEWYQQQEAKAVVSYAPYLLYFNWLHLYFNGFLISWVHFWRISSLP